jgi:hypothetical protein
VKLRGWPEIGPDGSVLLTPHVPQGITGIDDDAVFMVGITFLFLPTFSGMQLRCKTRAESYLH